MLQNPYSGITILGICVEHMLYMQCFIKEKLRMKHTIASALEIKIKTKNLEGSCS